MKIEIRIVVERPAPGWEGTHIWGAYLIAGDRRCLLPDNKGLRSMLRASRGARIIARWWSEKTGIPFEEPVDE